jgi:hypothetical protein
MCETMLSAKHIILAVVGCTSESCGDNNDGA